VHFEDDLYPADSSELLQRLREVSPTAGSVMLIGHNPGIQELALTLAKEGDGQGLTARLAEKFPTAGLAVLVLPGDQWSGLGPGQARLESLLIPRQLG
jgi:phosphohistidine phosphatase